MQDTYAGRITIQYLFVTICYANFALGRIRIGQ